MTADLSQAAVLQTPPEAITVPTFPLHPFPCLSTALQVDLAGEEKKVKT